MHLSTEIWLIPYMHCTEMGDCLLLHHDTFHGLPRVLLAKLQYLSIRSQGLLVVVVLKESGMMGVQGLTEREWLTTYYLRRLILPAVGSVAKSWLRTERQHGSSVTQQTTCTGLGERWEWGNIYDSVSLKGVNHVFLLMTAVNITSEHFLNCTLN